MYNFVKVKSDKKIKVRGKNVINRELIKASCSLVHYYSYFWNEFAVCLEIFIVIFEE